jgi:rSAM/selenodomain-associated transferase 1
MTGGPEIAILAKAPVAGLAKTRLIPALGAGGAARLQATLTERTVQTALAAGLGPVTLWCTPDCADPAFEDLAARYAVHLRLQVGADLGERMATAVASHTIRGPVIVLGTDCPALTPAHLQESAAALAGGLDAALVPAEDGGYVLIGLARARPSVFDGVSWGTGRVLAETRDRLRAAGLHWFEGPLLWDVDRPADLARLATLGVIPAESD